MHCVNEYAWNDSKFTKFRESRSLNGKNTADRLGNQVKKEWELPQWSHIVDLPVCACFIFRFKRKAGRKEGKNEGSLLQGQILYFIALHVWSYIYFQNFRLYILSIFTSNIPKYLAKFYVMRVCHLYIFFWLSGWPLCPLVRKLCCPVAAEWMKTHIAGDSAQP